MVRADVNGVKMNGNIRIPNGVIPPIIPNVPVGIVPVRVRERIQLMLLLRHNVLGCTIPMVQDEYRIYYREDIFPEMFGFRNWVELLKSMPEHVEVGSRGRHKVVNPVPLGQAPAIKCLGRIFDTPDAVISHIRDNVQNDFPEAPIQNGINDDGFNDARNYIEELLGGNIPNPVNENFNPNLNVEENPVGANNVVNGFGVNEGPGGMPSIPVGNMLALPEAVLNNGPGVSNPEIEVPSIKAENGVNHSSTSTTTTTATNHDSVTPSRKRQKSGALVSGTGINCVPNVVPVSGELSLPVTPEAPPGSSNAIPVKADASRTSSLSIPGNANANRTSTPPNEKAETKFRRNSTVVVDSEGEEIQIIEVVTKPQGKRSRLDKSGSKPPKTPRGIQLVSPTSPLIFETPPASITAPPAASSSSSSSSSSTSTASSSSTPAISIVADTASTRIFTAGPPPLAKDKDESEPPKATKPPPDATPEKEVVKIENSGTPLPLPQPIEVLSNHTNEEISFNEVALAVEPIPSTSTSVPKFPVIATKAVEQEASESSNAVVAVCTNSIDSLDSLSESTKKLAASLPKCEVKLTRLKITETTPPPSPTENATPRKRKHSESSNSSSVNRDNVRCSPRLLEKASTPRKESPSPAKSPAKKSKRRGPPSRSNLEDAAAVEDDVDEIDPVSQVPFPKWYTIRNESDGVEQDYENFMKYSALPPPIPQIEESEGGSFPYGPYFPPNCKVNVEEVGSNVDLGKTAEYLRYHLFWNLLPENLSRDVWEIRMNDDVIFPLMSLESYQLAELDKSFGFEISQHGNCSSQLNVISSYGNYADYFLWKRGPNSKCIGLMPHNGKGMAKPRRSAGISYEKFSNFRDGTVDIFDPETTRDFERHVESAYPDKVDVFVASGIAYQGMQNRSEDLALVQALLALKLVREGGIFILKIENTTSDFLIGLIFYLGHCFSKITIEKPESALPGERFLVCFWKLKDVSLFKVTRFFEECNQFRIEQNWEQSDLAIQSIFGFDDVHPIDLLSSIDAEFVHFIRMHNEQISQKEANIMMAIESRYQHVLGDAEDTSEERSENELQVDNQMETERNELFLKWGLHLREKITDAILINDLPPYVLNWINKNSKTTRVSDVVREGNWMKAGDIEQWTFILSTSSKNRAIVLVKSEDPQDLVCQYKDCAWQIIPGLVLPRGTVLYAEIIPASKSRRPIFNIIDASSLGEKSLADLNYSMRLEECAEFIGSHLTASNANYCITCAKGFEMQSLPEILLELFASKGKFNPRYFKTALCEPSTTKSTSTDLNVDVRDIVFFQTKTKFDGVMASAGWRIADFGRVVYEEVSWEWIPKLQAGTVVPPLRSLVTAEMCFPVFQHLDKVDIETGLLP